MDQMKAAAGVPARRRGAVQDPQPRRRRRCQGRRGVRQGRADDPAALTNAPVSEHHDSTKFRKYEGKREVPHLFRAFVLSCFRDSHCCAAMKSTTTRASSSPLSSCRKWPPPVIVVCGWPVGAGNRLLQHASAPPVIGSMSLNAVRKGFVQRRSTSHARRFGAAAGSSGEVGTSSGNCRAPAL